VVSEKNAKNIMDRKKKQQGGNGKGKLLAWVSKQEYEMASKV